MALARSTPTYPTEVWMVLKDRHYLRYCVTASGLSLRKLAPALGLRSHGYLSALLNGDATTLTPELAARIAAYFGTLPNFPENSAQVHARLFVPTASTSAVTRRALQEKAA